MPVIHSEWLLTDRRLRRCSDQATMAFPFLFSAANSYGRLEIDTKLLVAQCFIMLDHPPAEEDIPRFFIEYHQALLVFLYVAPNGAWWAHFDVPRNCLPRYPFTRDRASPVPPSQSLSDWRCNGKLLESKALQLFYEDLRKNTRRALALALAVAVDNTHVDQLSLIPSLIPCANGKTADWKQRAFLEFWEIVWHKVGKGAARKAWMKTVRSEEQAVQIRQAAIDHGPIHRQLSELRGHSCLHPATWLNGGRHEDSMAELERQLEQARLAHHQRYGTPATDDSWAEGFGK